VTHPVNLPSDPQVMNQYKILIVDDEEPLRLGLQTYLKLEGYDVDAAGSADEALSNGLDGYDLILLDIMMDGVSGLEMVQILKKNSTTANIPVIFLTAKNSEDDMVSGLNLGADDYITKPYSIKNLLARITAVLRRSGIKKENGVVCDRASLTCSVDGRMVKLPKKEFELLALFLENRGRIFTREELFERIWPEHSVVVDRSIDVHITRLRGKIVPYGKHIVNRSGYGYGWQD